jgi:hypothetical protein
MMVLSRKRQPVSSEAVPQVQKGLTEWDELDSETGRVMPRRITRFRSLKALFHPNVSAL